MFIKRKLFQISLVTLGLIIVFLTYFTNLEKNITIVEWPEIIKKKPINRIDLFFEYRKDMKERILSIQTSGRLNGNEF